MTYKEINNLISALAAQLKIPYSYHHFEKKTSPPFLVFSFPENDDLYADNINYQTIVSMELAFCCDTKDFDTEQIIETYLKNNELSFDKDEDYIADQHMWQITYYTEVLINEQS